MKNFLFWKEEYQASYKRWYEYSLCKHGPKRAREIALIKANEDTKRAQEAVGESKPSFWVDNPNYYYPGMPGKAIEGK